MLSLPPAGGTGKKINGTSLFGKDRYAQYVREMNSHGTIEGIPLTKSERKEGFESRDSKVNFEKFVGKVVTKKKASAKGTGSGPVGQKLLMGRNVKFSSESFTAPDIPEPETQTQSQDASEKEDFEGVGDKIDELIAEIRAENKADRKDADSERKRLELEKRKKKEEMKEKVKSFIAAPIKKVLAPVTSIFKAIWDALGKILFAKVMMKFIDWFTDKENKKKIDAIGRFIKDFWPAIVSGFLIFGTALGGLAAFVTAGAGFALIGKLLALTAKLAIAAAKFGFGAAKWAARNPIAAGLLVLGGWGISKILGDKWSKQDEKDQKELEGDDPEPSGDDPEPSGDDQQPTTTTGSKEEQKSGGFLGGLFGGGDKQQSGDLEPQEGSEGNSESNPTKFSGGGLSKGTDVVPAMLTPGEFIMSKGAVDKFGVDTLESMNSVGGGDNRPKVSKNGIHASGGGLINVKGSGDGSTGKLTMHDEKGKQQGGSWDIISGLFGKGGATQKERMDISGTGLPMPDGEYGLSGFDKHGPWPGLPGIGDWSTFIDGEGKGKVGKRTGLMLHSDIDPYGTMGCIGVALGGKPGSKAEKAFLSAYAAANPGKISVKLLGGGASATKADRSATADNTLQLSGQTKGGSNAKAIVSKAAQVGRSVLQQLPLVIPTPPPVSRGESPDVPTLGDIDPNNPTLWLQKSMYNVGG